MRKIGQLKREVALMQHVALESGGGVFHRGLVENLPEPAQRYLLHAIRAGARLAGSVTLRIKGRLRLSPAKNWMALDSTETIGEGRGFVWKASTGGLVRISGFDRYSNGTGEMSWKIWGVVPAMSASGPDVTRSARGRFAGELVILPSALLPQRGVAWTAEGSDAACAAVQVDDERIELHLTLDAEGRLRRLDMSRWGNFGLPAKQWTHIPYSVVFAGEQQFEDYSIPERFTVAWREFDYFEGKILSAGYR
jgi:hypothetical protein